MPDLPWYIDFDREEVVLAATRAFGSGGLLVITGTDRSGRNEAAEVVEHRLSSAHTRVLRSRETAQSVSPLQGALRDLLGQIAGAVDPLGETPIAALMASASAGRLAKQLTTALRNSQPVPVLLIEEVDAGHPLSDESLGHLSALSRSGGLVIVTSRREDATDWRTNVVATVVELLDFSVIEVRDHVDRRYPGSEGRRARTEAAQLLTAAAPQGRIDPRLAYDIMALIDRSFA